jgi:predicted nucleotidyltransferase
MLTEADIRRITDRIVTGYGPIVVGTFGSYATGLARPKSDLDLFVIKSTVERSSARRRAVQRLLFNVLHPLDVHVFTPEEFEETAKEELSFTWIIARQAHVYYWKAGCEHLVPSLCARS